MTAIEWNCCEQFSHIWTNMENIHKIKKNSGVSSYFHLNCWSFVKCVFKQKKGQKKRTIHIIVENWVKKNTLKLYCFHFTSKHRASPYLNFSMFKNDYQTMYQYRPIFFYVNHSKLFTPPSVMFTHKFSYGSHQLLKKKYE